jgi:hypothetical protein
MSDHELYLEYAKEMLDRTYLPLDLEHRLRRIAELVDGVHAMFTSRQVVALVILMWEESRGESL